VERKFDHPLYISTFTIRNNSNQFALPMRRYTKQIQYPALGHGVGGAGMHYGGGLGRFSPRSYQPVTMSKAKYGEAGYNAILSNVKGGTPDLEDWPVTYDDMAPYYT
jgi:choline dehydrogenase-like flavoprotein